MESLSQLKGGVAPGSGGLRPDFLVVLAEKMEREQMELFEEFGLKYLQGDLPAWFYTVWLSVQAVALFKNRENTAVRPLGMRNPLLKQFHREPITQNKDAIVNYFAHKNWLFQRVEQLNWSSLSDLWLRLGETLWWSRWILRIHLMLFQELQPLGICKHLAGSCDWSGVIVKRGTL